jgi:hypothetical protein
MTTRQDKFHADDLERSRMRDALRPDEQRLGRLLNADYRLAEYPDTARLLVREKHGMLTRSEAERLERLRSCLIKLSELVEAGML